MIILQTRHQYVAAMWLHQVRAAALLALQPLLRSDGQVSPEVLREDLAKSWHDQYDQYDQ